MLCVLYNVITQCYTFQLNNYETGDATMQDLVEKIYTFSWSYEKLCECGANGCTVYMHCVQLTACGGGGDIQAGN